MTRVIAMGARGSAMLAVFIFGVTYTSQATLQQASTFFVAYAATSLLIAVMGLELHTYSDREVARGMRPITALAGLARLEAPWMAVVCLLTVVLGWIAMGGPLVPLLIACNAVIGTAVQEAFRIFVALGRNANANLLMVLRNTVPFSALTILVLCGVDTSVGVVLVAWLATGVGAAVLAIVILVRASRGMEDGHCFSATNAFRTARHYLPVAVVIRSMLTVDIIVIGVIGSAAISTMVGNVANIAAAFFAFADLAIVQWRLHSFLSNPSANPDSRRHLRDSVGIAVISSLSIGAVALLTSSGVFGVIYATTEIATSIIILAIASGLAIIAQSAQLPLFALNRDRTVLSTYLWAGCVYFAVMAMALLTQAPLLAVGARALGLGVVAGLLVRALRKESQDL